MDGQKYFFFGDRPLDWTLNLCNEKRRLRLMTDLQHYTARRPKFSFCGSQTIFSLQIKRQKTFQLRAICNHFNCLWHFSLWIIIFPLSFCVKGVITFARKLLKVLSPKSHFKVALLSFCCRKCEFWPASVRINNTASRNFYNDISQPIFHPVKSNKRTWMVLVLEWQNRKADSNLFYQTYSIFNLTLFYTALLYQTKG